ncbi:hypothetical protein ACLBWT_15535 [Paenibacillus sp. D51F]
MDLQWYAYLAHNVEEYGIDLRGRLHEFPNTMATMLYTAASPGGLLPNGFLGRSIFPSHGSLRRLPLL